MKHNRLPFLLVFLLTSFMINAEGTRQVAPNGSISIMGTNTTDIAALHLDHPSYDNFAAYTNPDITDRLQIRIIDPSAECIHFGFSAGHLNVTGMNPTPVTFEFRVKDPAGNIVYGPITVAPADANINSWNEGFMGPEAINGPGGYQSMEITSADLMSGGWAGAGDYYIEFREAANQPFLIDFWDITVADCSGAFPVERPGRVWSYNWAFFAINDFGFPERPFNGAFYVCAPDPDNPDAAFVTRIDFNGSGFRPAAFVVAFNSFGSMNSGNVTEDRKSVQNANSTQAEYAIFLNDPLEFCETAIVGELELFGVTRCSADEFCIKYQSSKEGQIDLLLDFDGPDSVYTPGTADLLIVANVTEEEVGVPECIDWDGLDGLGNPLPNDIGTSIPILISYAQGVYHFPIYDAEFMDNGFSIETIRPVGPQPLLYYDDSNIDTPSGSGEPDVQLSGCSLPCHTWSAFNDPNVPGFGNLNTINSWWFAQQVLTQEVFVLPTYFECGIEGPDVVCEGDTSALTWTSTSLPVEGIDPDIVSIDWEGPEIIGDPSGNDVLIGGAGTYFADMTWLTPFGDTCMASCEFTVTEVGSSTTEIDTALGFGDTLVINNEEYFESGEYEQVLTSANGCDSILIIRLTVPQTVLYYDLDACVSVPVEGTNVDYTEFEPQYTDPLDCGDLVATNIYRDNPDQNPHSCTPGVDSSIAMCVGSLDDCDYDAGSEKSVVFEITISPDTENNVVINSLAFWEKGPEEFDWIDGYNGPNNYPTLYGIRVLKDDTEIFRMEGIATEREWNEEFYDFNDIEEFTAHDTSVYRFELLGYCTFDNGAEVNAWDLDEFSVHASCTPKVDTNGIIEGVVSELRSGALLGDIELLIAQDHTFDESGACFSGNDGVYRYGSAAVGYDHYVTATYNYDPLEGVTAFDLLAMQKHMLGIEPFENGYQYIAADINNDGQLSASDIVELRKLMLNQIEGFTRNESWRFFNLLEVVPDDPFSWPEIAHLTDFNGYASGVDFKGVKIGDVVHTATGTQGASSAIFIENKRINTGDDILIPVRMPRGVKTEGLQVQFIAHGGEIVEVMPGLLGTEYMRVNSGSATIIWSDPLRERSDEPLFYIRLKAVKPGMVSDMISLGYADVLPEVYDVESDAPHPIKLVFENAVSDMQLELMAQPNPATERTMLTFNSALEGTGALTVYGCDGRVLHTQSVLITEGHNMLAVSRDALSGYQGVAICRLTSEYVTGTIKVVF